MKERHIYQVLNRCKKSQYLKGGIILRAWITAYDMDTLQDIVEDIKVSKKKKKKKKKKKININHIL